MSRDRRGPRWLRWCSPLIVAAYVTAGCADAAAPPSAVTAVASPVTSPVASPVTSVVTAGVTPEGFADAHLAIRRADGTICDLCTYLAHTPADRQRGLMGVTDLAGRDGMIFVYDEPGTLRFWMKDTVMPLSAAWFAADGAFISSVDMTPCPAGTDRCPTYGPVDPALHVLEVPQGDLDMLGIGPGSTLLTSDGRCE